MNPTLHNCDEFFDEIFDQLLWQLIDEDGRPLGEQKARAVLQQSFIPMELRTCGYPGSRYQHVNQMNVSALKQIRSQWAQVLNAAAWLHHNVVRNCMRETDEPTLYALYEATRSATLLPQYLVRRSRDCFVSGRVPVALAAVYKVMIGYVGLLHRMNIDRVLQDGLTFPTATLDEIMNEAEESGALIGASQVCAGPEHMIREILSTLMTGGSADSSALTTWWPEDEKSVTEALRYARLAIRLELVKSLLGVVIRDNEKAVDDRPVPYMSINWDLEFYPEEERADVNTELRNRISQHIRAVQRVGDSGTETLREFLDRFDQNTVQAEIAVTKTEHPDCVIDTYATVHRAALDEFNDTRKHLYQVLSSENYKPITTSDLETVFGKLDRMMRRY